MIVCYPVAREKTDKYSKMLSGYSGRLLKIGFGSFDLWEVERNDSLDNILGDPIIPKLELNSKVKYCGLEMLVIQIKFAELNGHWVVIYILRDGNNTEHEVLEFQIDAL